MPEKENLCLYGLPNETWEVTLPAEEVPPELPEPALGINFARDGMVEKDWLSLVAVHSDAWLLSVAFYFGARFGFDKDARFVYCFYYKGLIHFLCAFIHLFTVFVFPFHVFLLQYGT
jgi:hypothetical protein